MASESDVAGHVSEAEQADSDLEPAHPDDVPIEALQVGGPPLGQGYEATLKQISDEVSRQLKELDKRWIARWAPQDLAIKNHERRIKALESRRPR